jgi:hypothetical protein
VTERRARDYDDGHTEISNDRVARPALAGGETADQSRRLLRAFRRC